METGSKEDHDIGLLAASIFDLLVGDFVKGQGSHPFPDFERPADGFVRVILPDLGSIILDTIKQKRQDKEGGLVNCQFRFIRKKKCN